MYVDLSFPVTVPVIAIIRRWVMALYTRVLDDEDAGARIGLATQELLENIARHSTDGEASLQIRAEARRVTIQTQNRARTADIETAEAQAREMATADPHLYYMATMEKAMYTASIGGLGLARIRAEADMTLAVAREGDRIAIVAVMEAA